MMDQRASTTSKTIFLEDGDLEASLCQARRCGNTTDAGTYFKIRSTFEFALDKLIVLTDDYGSLRHRRVAQLTRSTNHSTISIC